MNRLFRLFPLVLLGAFCFFSGAMALAETPAPAPVKAGKKARPVCIWKVKGEKTEHYLVGSVHLLTENEYPLPAIYDDVYEKAKQLVFEVPMSELTNLESVAKMMQVAMYEEGKSLKSELTPETYKALVKVLNSSPDLTPLLVVADRMRPGFLVMAIADAMMKKVGASEKYGLDLVFNQRATDDGKPTSGLETIEFQMGLFSQLTKEEGEQMVKESLASLDEVGDQFLEMIKLWKRGKAKRLAKLMNHELAATPEFADKLLYARNRNWIPKIEELLKSDEPAMIIVGAAHLSGENSVVDLLEKEGYQIEQLTRPKAKKGEKVKAPAVQKAPPALEPTEVF